MSAVLDLTATTDYARTSTSQSNIGTPSTLSVKVKVNGQYLLTPTGYGSANLVEIGNLAGTFRCCVGIYHNPETPGGTTVDVYVNNTNYSPLLVGPLRSGINASDWFVIYASFSSTATGMFYAIYEEDGTPINSQDDSWSQFIGASNSANGRVTVGQGVNCTPWTTDSSVGEVDGVAIYSATLSGADRYSAPHKDDANILAYWPFDEGAGGTAANEVAGGEDLTLSGAGWQTGGSWDGVGGGSIAHIATPRYYVQRG